MDFPSIICLATLVVGLFLPVSFLMTISMALASFGSLAIVPTEYTGGTSILASTAGPLFLVLKVLVSGGGPGGIVTASFDTQRLGLLTLFTFVAIVEVAILPFLFRGEIDVYPMKATHLISTPEPLAPTIANLTQSAYLVISFFVAAGYCWLARRQSFVDEFGRAAIIGGAAVAMTGLLDVVTTQLGIGDVLSVFRTANYAFITAAEVQGVKRTIGLMPEASSFGGLAAFFFSLLLFIRNAYAPSVRWRVVVLAAICGIFAVISTSSAAYAMICVTVAIFTLDCAHGLLLGQAPSRPRILRELMLVLAIVTVTFITILFFDQTRDTLINIVDQMVFQKAQSSSFIERSSWTNVAFQAWLATKGLGVGVGSVRTSNFFVNILASTGFLGFGIFLTFLIKLFVTKPSLENERMAELVHGSKLALLPTLVAAFLAGTTPDYGSTVGAIFGIVIGSTAASHRNQKIFTPIR